MTSLDSFHGLPALVAALVCGVLGWFAPQLIARLPEPEPEEQPAGTEKAPEKTVEETADDKAEEKDGDRLFAAELAPAPPKEPYAELAARPGLAPRLAFWSVLGGAFLGGAVGWTGALLYLVPLVPIGVTLFFIDVRTTLLPTRIIHPTYALLAVLIPVAALVDSDLHSLYRAGIGWLVVGGWFWLFWFAVNAWGFGDVRLSRVLGPALGYLGWSQLLLGLTLIVFIGGIGGAVLAVVNRSLRKRFPYGPFMLLGALIAAGVGPWLATSLGY